jgi:hypothetical protein
MTSANCEKCHEPFEKASNSQRFCSKCRPAWSSREYYHRIKNSDPVQFAIMKDRHRWACRLSRLGITREQFDTLLKAQDGKCAICGVLITSLLPRQVHVDHDHETGQVRGILCAICNQGLGLFKDTIELLEAAIRYLKPFKKR